jgi:hypothetical protein
MLHDEVPRDHMQLWMSLFMTALVTGGLFAAYHGDLAQIKKEILVFIDTKSEVKESSIYEMNPQPAAVTEVIEPIMFIPRTIFQLR